MKNLSPVVWSEGMYLGPHQFQAQNRYFEDSIEFATSALWFENWGLAGYEISQESLANGQLQLVHARGIFPDGLAFDMPDSDALPEPRNIAEVFPPTRNHLVVQLAVPDLRTGQNFALNGAVPQPVRYTAENRLLNDETTGRDERQIRLGRKNIRIVFETEDVPGVQRLAIARVMRSGTGSFLLDSSFVPPCLEIAASKRLMQMLGTLLDLMEDRSRALSLAAGEQPAFSLQELTRFWFLHALNAAITPLRHLYMVRRGHPEQLFMELSRLGGALCTFGIDSHPRSLPKYDHNDLGKCFSDLDLHIRKHLEIVIPTSCLRIPLVPDQQPYFYFGDVIDQRCFGRATWLFAVRSSGGEINTIQNAPRLVKICSQAFVPELVKRALPGFAMTHMPAPPSSVPVRPGTQYFLLNTSGPCWDHIRKTSRVGVYVPGEIPDPEIELLAVVEP